MNTGTIVYFEPIPHALYSLEILTGASNVSAAENSRHQMHYLLLFDSHNKLQGPAVFVIFLFLKNVSIYDSWHLTYYYYSSGLFGFSDNTKNID